MLINFFKKKTKPAIPQEEKPKEQKQREPEAIMFNQTDNCFERAEKICLASVLIDRGFVVHRMARAIQIYMDLDKQAVEFKNNNNEG